MLYGKIGKQNCRQREERRVGRPARLTRTVVQCGRDIRNVRGTRGYTHIINVLWTCEIVKRSRKVRKVSHFCRRADAKVARVVLTICM
jgi:hypothetical protein